MGSVGLQVGRKRVCTRLDFPDFPAQNSKKKQKQFGMSRTHKDKKTQNQIFECKLDAGPAFRYCCLLWFWVFWGHTLSGLTYSRLCALGSLLILRINLGQPYTRQPPEPFYSLLLWPISHAPEALCQ